MAILEINLEKPALVEEYQYPGETTEEAAEESTADSSSSGGGKVKLLGLLGVLAGVGLLVWKLKNRGSTEQTDFEEFEEYDEKSYEEESYEFESEESGGAKRKVAGLLGLAVGLVGLVAAVQKRRK